MAEATLDLNAPQAGISAVRTAVLTTDTLIGNAQQRQLAQQAQSFGQYMQMRQAAQTDRQLNQTDQGIVLAQQRFNQEKLQYNQARNDIKRVLSTFGNVPVGDQQAAELATKLKTLDYVKQQDLASKEQGAVLRQELLRASTLSDPSARLSSLREALAANPLGFETLTAQEQAQFMDVSKQAQAVSVQNAYADLLSANTMEEYQAAIKKNGAAVAASPSLAALYQNKYTVLSVNQRATDANTTKLTAAQIAANKAKTSQIPNSTLEKYYLDKTGVSDTGGVLWYYNLPGATASTLAYDGKSFYDLNGNTCSPIEFYDGLRNQAASDATFQERQSASGSFEPPSANLDIYGDTRLQTAATIDNTFLNSLQKNFSYSSQ